MKRRNALHIIGVSGIGAALPSLSHAETMLNEFIVLWKTTRDYTLETLDAMPAEKFDFKPTSVQMTFGKQFTHTGSTNSYLFGVTKNKPRIPEPEDTGKESARDYLVKTFDHCTEILMEMTGQDLANKDFKPKPNWLADDSVRDILLRAYVHVAHHRGQAIVYLRLNDIKPPRFRV
ncbi:DinB family protein [Candidatus Latescibacterota bacterium]